MLTSDKMTAKVWDDYMNRFGIEAYVAARYFSAPTSTRTDRDAPRPLRRLPFPRHSASPAARIAAVKL